MLVSSKLLTDVSVKEKEGESFDMAAMICHISRTVANAISLARIVFHREAVGFGFGISGAPISASHSMRKS